MRNVVKVWLYAALSLGTGAWITPVVYNAGKALAEISEAKVTNGPVARLADWCRAAPLPEFYLISMILAGMLWLMPFMEWLRAETGTPAGVASLRWNRSAEVFQASAAAFLMAGFALSLAGMAVFGGVLNLIPLSPGWVRLLIATLAGSILLAILIESLFRGVVEGIFLRAFTPRFAILFSALLFAGVVFLLSAKRITVADEEAANTGFELLIQFATRSGKWTVWLTDFSPLLLMGLLLGYARWRTGSLWLPIGLQAGWFFASYSLTRFTLPAERPGHLGKLLVGDAVHSGILPFAAIGFAAVIVYYFARPPHESTVHEVH